MPRAIRKKITFQGKIKFKKRSEMEKIATLNARNSDCIFIRLHSWDGFRTHIDANKLDGKKVRMVIEVLD